MIPHIKGFRLDTRKNNGTHYGYPFYRYVKLPFASKKYHPLKDLDTKRWKARNLQTWYYTTNLHKGAFMLPRYVEDLLVEEEKAAKKESKENIE